MNVADDLKEIFERMPGAFLAEKAADMNAAIQLELTGEGGGNWILKITQGKLLIQEGTASSPNLTLNMATSDYVAISRGEANPMSLFMLGKIKVQGDMTLAMKFPEMFTRS